MSLKKLIGGVEKSLNPMAVSLSGMDSKITESEVKTICSKWNKLFQCAQCGKRYQTPVFLSCGHIFCKMCASAQITERVPQANEEIYSAVAETEQQTELIEAKIDPEYRSSSPGDKKMIHHTVINEFVGYEESDSTKYVIRCRICECSTLVKRKREALPLHQPLNSFLNHIMQKKCDSVKCKSHPKDAVFVCHDCNKRGFCQTCQYHHEQLFPEHLKTWCGPKATVQQSSWLQNQLWLFEKKNQPSIALLKKNIQKMKGIRIFGCKDCEIAVSDENEVFVLCRYDNHKNEVQYYTNNLENLGKFGKKILRAPKFLSHVRGRIMVCDGDNKLVSFMKNRHEQYRVHTIWEMENLVSVIKGKEEEIIIFHTDWAEIFDNNLTRISEIKLQTSESTHSHKSQFAYDIVNEKLVRAFHTNKHKDGRIQVIDIKQGKVVKELLNGHYATLTQDPWSNILILSQEDGSLYLLEADTYNLTKLGHIEGVQVQESSVLSVLKGKKEVFCSIAADSTGHLFVYNEHQKALQKFKYMGI